MRTNFLSPHRSVPSPFFCSVRVVKRSLESRCFQTRNDLLNMIMPASLQDEIDHGGLYRQTREGTFMVDFLDVGIGFSECRSDFCERAGQISQFDLKSHEATRAYHATLYYIGKRKGIYIPAGQHHPDFFRGKPFAIA